MHGSAHTYYSKILHTLTPIIKLINFSQPREKQCLPNLLGAALNKFFLSSTSTLVTHEAIKINVKSEKWCNVHFDLASLPCAPFREY